MKRGSKKLVCVLAAVLLCACGTKGESTIVEEVVTTAAVSDNKPEASAERILTSDEVQYFEDYLNRMDNYGFLLSMYENPSEVDLEQVFYVGAGMEIAEMSEEECQAYLKVTGMEEIYTDVTHLTTAQIEGFLQEKLGLTLQEMSSPFSWVYVPEYDSYYHQAGDTNVISWDCVGGSVSEEIYKLKVSCPYDYLYDCEVTLKKVGEGYQFVSNQPREYLVVPVEGLYTGLSWQQSYIKIIQDIEPGWQGYELIYLNEDEVPELVLIGVDAATGCRVYNYDDGMVYETQLNRLFFSYIERENLLCNAEGNMHHYYDIVYQIADGQMEAIAIGVYGVADNVNLEVDENGDLVYQYQWDGVEVSEEEYQQKLNAVYDTSKVRDGYEWGEWYTLEEIVEVLLEWE